MPALAAVLTLAVLAYLPGRCLMRLLSPEGGRAGGERLLLELLLGNVAVGLVGLALAQLGWFSLGALLGVLVVVSLAARLAAGSPPPTAYAGEGLGVAAAASILAVALAWVMPPFDTTLYGHDSSVYIGSGRYLAEHGSIAISDPTLDEMSPDLRAQFFASYGREAGKPPFVRLAGGLLLTDLEGGMVLPAFHHLVSVWVALAYGVGGDGAVAAPASYFGALSVLAIAAFAGRLVGGAGVVASIALMLLSTPQYWYSRFLMPEVPSQFFLWAGLVAAAGSLERPASRLGIAAGLGLGMAGLMRVDGMAHLLAALALWKIVVPGRWPAGRGFVAAFALVVVYAGVHQLLFPTHYYTEAVDLLRGAGLRLQASWAPLLAGLGILAVVQRRRSAGLARWLTRVLAGLAFAVYVLVAFVYTRPDWGTVLSWLSSYVGAPAFAAAAVGGFLWARRGPTDAERFALLLGILVLAQVAYDPRVSPAPLWAIRRFVPIALPAILIAAVLTLDAIWRRRKLLAAVAAVVVVLGTGGRTALAYRTSAFESSSAHVRSIAAGLPADSVVVVDPEFAVASQLHIALWTTAGLPAYLLGPRMSKPLDDLLGALRRRPVYWIGTGDDTTLALLASRGEPVSSYRFALGTRRLGWYEARDDLGVRDLTVWVYRLRGEDERSLH